MSTVYRYVVSFDVLCKGGLSRSTILESAVKPSDMNESIIAFELERRFAIKQTSFENINYQEKKCNAGI